MDEYLINNMIGKNILGIKMGKDDIEQDYSEDGQDEMESAGIEYDSLGIDRDSEDNRKKEEAGNSIELNIQPAASILNVFSRLSYKPWYAIAEFVDNSTQSYISHQEELNNDEFFEKLVVDVRYDSEENTLSIVDNAYGMEIDRFKDAIILDSRNETQSGRNEFGMGLKTAASWFGNIWTVKSTQYDSNNCYVATVDIPKLKENNLNSIEIHRSHVNSKKHGTEIIIEQVTKRITAPRTIGKIRNLLSSMYRRDINNRNIEIWFNGVPIEFEDYPVLTNFRENDWKKDLDFRVQFLDREYRVTGFVAIRDPGSYSKSGFALFRQDRVVIGGDDANYKPKDIFVQAQSQISLKLFGELNMDDFPVNQAKDGFIWDDGLEEAFIDELKANIQEYIKIAELSKKDRDAESQYSDEKSEELHKDVENAIQNAFNNDFDNIDDNGESSFIEEKEVGGEINEEPFEEEPQPGEEPVGEEINEELFEEEPQPGEEIDEKEEDDKLVPEEEDPDYQQYTEEETEENIVGTNRNYTIRISPVEEVDFVVKWATGNNNYWIKYDNYKSDIYDVTINIEHPFFMPFSKDEEFKKVLEKFALAFILSERQAKNASNYEGYVPSNVIKNFMNKYLQKLAED